MPLVGFELTIPVFDRANSVRALDRAAIAISKWNADSVWCSKRSPIEIRTTPNVT
jgi:hypothetical protein